MDPTTPLQPNATPQNRYKLIREIIVALLLFAIPTALFLYVNKPYKAPTNTPIIPSISITPTPTQMLTPTATLSASPTRNQNEVMCTQEAKQCPDGSYVGRVPPSCNFAPCPK